MQIINDLNAISTPGDLLDQVPASIYWKDLNGEYIGYNQHAGERLSNESLLGDLRGANDFQIFGRATGLLYSENDNIVIKERKVMVFEENAIIKGNLMKQVSTKQPIIRDGKVTGIIGTTILTERHDKSSALPAPLTTREQDVLAFYCRGMTAKQIAEQLHISFRTVQKHIENIRSKTNCDNRADLFDYFYGTQKM